MKVVRPLVCIPSARNIRITTEAFGKLHFDRFWAKFYPERLAYPLLRRYFLEHAEYSHLVVAPDDLLVENAHMESLISDLEKEDYPILSGVCNINHEPIYDHMLTIVRNEVVTPLRHARHYIWVTDSEFDPASPIIQVKFSGFPLMFIRRDIVERIPFQDDSEANGHYGTGGAVDVMFCYDCHLAGIPIHADMRVRMDHLSGEYRVLLVGKEPPYCDFQQRS